MFSIFMPAKPSDRKTETMEELMQKLNDAMKQLRDPLLSVEDREQLYDAIDYCASHINTFTMQKIESEQLATAPNLDNLPAEATNEPAKLTNLDQNLSSVQDPPNPAIIWIITLTHLALDRFLQQHFAHPLLTSLYALELPNRNPKIQH